ncbi:hypothetical protein B0H14DRAFT_3422910 [Mycena olivaceomarginata]|nr:hypothetical protein B0H14DRAFT_3422910 [Mycena olivaceomarginata]
MPSSVTNTHPAVEATFSVPRQRLRQVNSIDIPTCSISPHVHGRYSHTRSLDPSLARVTRPPKQWVIGGVKKFFAQRINAIDHILTLHLGQASIMGSHNIHKLRAFTNGVKYVRKPGHAWDSDEE